MKPRWAIAVLLLGVMLCSSAEAGAGEAEARAALERGETAEAAALYETVLKEQGPTADLYYNLGLAWAHQRAYARAVLALERARVLDPEAEDIGAALEAVREALREDLLEARPERELVEGESESLSRWRFFHAWDPGTISWLLLLVWWLSLGAVIGRRYARHPAVRDGLMVVAVLTFLGASVCGFYAGGQWWTRDVRPAVVVFQSPELYELPTKMSSRERVDTLYGGAVVEIVSSRAGWHEIELANGRRGWLEAGAVEDVRVGEVTAR